MADKDVNKYLANPNLKSPQQPTTTLPRGTSDGPAHPATEQYHRSVINEDMANQISYDTYKMMKD